MFRYYPDEESFDRKIAACEQALALAKDFGKPDLANETRVILSYVKMAKHIHRIAKSVASEGASGPDRRKGLLEDVEGLKKAGAENADALKAWRSAASPDPWHRRVHRAIETTEQTVKEIAESVAGATGR
jgi:hypothetical protein